MAGRLGQGDDRLLDETPDASIRSGTADFFCTRLSDDVEANLLAARSINGQIATRAKSSPAGSVMSYITPGILGVVAIAATFGAVQLASGQDVGAQIRASHEAVAAANNAGVNRDGKGDRLTSSVSSSRTQTVSVPVGGVDSTSILVRVPVAAAERQRPATPSLLTPAASRRAPVACEPMVSALSEVARLLGPGRCVT